jgi:hypothetical protein
MNLMSGRLLTGKEKSAVDALFVRAAVHTENNKSYWIS